MELARRAKNDESRHVHFGLAHVRHGLASDPALSARLAHARFNPVQAETISRLHTPNFM